MTLIEFFEKDAVENICSSLTKAPDRVILIGDKSKLMQKHAENYRKILSSRGMDVEFICRVINKNNMHTIIEALSMFVEEYDDCVFDLTGGEDLYLVAVGILSERYKEKNIQMHRFNIRNNTIIDCDEDGNTILEGKTPVLSVEEHDISTPDTLRRHQDHSVPQMTEQRQHACAGDADIGLPVLGQLLPDQGEIGFRGDGPHRSFFFIHADTYTSTCRNIMEKTPSVKTNSVKSVRHAVNIHRRSRWLFICGHSPRLLACALAGAITVCHLRGACSGRP